MGHSMVIGIDPGNNGAIVALRDKQIHKVFKYSNGEDAIVSLLGDLAANHAVAYLEKVWGMGHDGGGGSFKFGRSYGFIRGVLLAYRIPIVDVLPRTWMLAMNVPPTKGEKARHRQEMVQMAQWFLDNQNANVQAINTTAAAILIAFYGISQEDEG